MGKKQGGELFLGESLKIGRFKMHLHGSRRLINDCMKSILYSIED
jgi:hypothetical protein